MDHKGFIVRKMQLLNLRRISLKRGNLFLNPRETAIEASLFATIVIPEAFSLERKLLTKPSDSGLMMFRLCI